MENRIIIIALCLLSFGGYAQQDPMFTNYMFNSLSVNSGYAGTREALSGILLHRSQWVGLDGAPTTQTLTIHSPLPFNLGIGGTIVQDKIGPTKTLSAYADIAYRINITKKAKLSLGLKAGMNQFNANLADLKLSDAYGQDIAFAQNVSNKMNPNFGFGAYYYSDKGYIGASVPKLLENEVVSDQGVNIIDRRHLFVIAGYVFDINPTVKFKPSVLAKAVDGAPLSLDVSANFLFLEKLWLGAFWRREDAVGLLAQYWINEKFRIGYAYGYTTSELTQYNSGSHEIMIGYDLNHKKGRMKSPRYF